MIHYSVTRDYSITHFVSRTAFFFFQTTLSILFFLVDFSKPRKEWIGEGKGRKEVQVQEKENGLRDVT